MSDRQEGATQDSAPRTPPGFRFEVGASLGGYELVRALRRGSFGECYEARKDGRLCHVRWLTGFGEDVVPLIREHQILDTRHLIAILDAQLAEAGLLIVTEPYPETVADRIGSGRLFSSSEAATCARAMLQAIEAMEKKSIFPLVVSPESIACWPDGFALDEHYLSMLYLRGPRSVPLERALYLPPDIDPSNPKPTDAIYGLGATLYAMLSGRALHEGTFVEIFVRAVQGAWTLDVSEPWATIVRSFLQSDPGLRPQSAAVALDMLHGAESSEPTAVRVATDKSQDGPATDEPALQFLELNEFGLQVFRRDPDGARMVLLNGGAAVIGSARGKSLGRDNEEPVTEVEIEPLLIDESPVTWSLLQRLMEQSGGASSLGKRRKDIMPQRYGGKLAVGWRWELDREVEGRITDDQPVIMLCQREVLDLAAGLGLELPSEAEWEFAYRGGTSTEFYWGDDFDPRAAWCNDNAEKGPQPVGQMAPNPFGLKDMAGNVAQMCRDFFHKDCYARVKTGESGFSTRELASGITATSPRRSIRGGSWKTGGAALRAAFRLGLEADVFNTGVGFRFIIRKSTAPDWARAVFDES